MLASPFVCAAICLICLGVVVFSTASRRPRRAVLATVVLLVFFPLNVLAAPSSYLVTGTTALMLLIGIFSVRRPPGSRASVVMAVLFFGYIVLYGFSSGTGGEIIMMLPAALCAIAASRLNQGDVFALCRLLGVLVVFHLTWSLLEVFARIPAIWPMSHGRNEISFRPNEIFPELAGRPMSSFSHPILLGYFFLLSVVFFLYAAHRGRSRGFLVLAAVALGGIALSGTRSAVLAAALVVVVALLLWFRVAKIGWYIALLVGVVGFVFVFGVDKLQAELGLGDTFVTTPSYLHRSLVVGSFWPLFGRDAGSVLLGNGTDIAAIFEAGIVRQYAADYDFFDNQFVFMMAVYGLVGMALFVGTVACAFIQGRSLEKLLVVAFFAMSNSFDTLTHMLPTLSLGLIAGLATAARGRELEPDKNAHVDTSLAPLPSRV